MNLLSLLELARDTMKGEWKKVNGTVASTSAAQASIAAPGTCIGDYTLSVALSVVEPEPVVGLPVGSACIPFGMGLRNGDIARFIAIQHQTFVENPTATNIG